MTIWELENFLIPKSKKERAGQRQEGTVSMRSSRWGSFKIGPYYYGQKPLENYLLDISEELQVQTQTLASHLQISHSNEVQTQRANEIVADEICALRYELGMFSAAVQENLQSIGLTLTSISGQLATIQKILRTPGATAARELLQQAEDLRSAGLFKDALLLYLKAANLAANRAECHYRLGTLYLFGKNREESVVNLSEAISSLNRARRLMLANYAGNDYGYHLLDRMTHCLALALYSKASDTFLSGQPGEEYLIQAWEVADPQKHRPSTETKLLAARIAALLKKRDAALAILRPLADYDRRILSNAEEHPDFVTLREELHKLRQELDEAGSFTLRVRARLKEHLSFAHQIKAWCGRQYPASLDKPTTELNGLQDETHSKDADFSHIIRAADQILLDAIRIAKDFISSLSNDLGRQHQDKINAAKARVPGGSIREPGEWPWQAIIMTMLVLSGCWVLIFFRLNIKEQWYGTAASRIPVTPNSIALCLVFSCILGVTSTLLITSIPKILYRREVDRRRQQMQSVSAELEILNSSPMKLALDGYGSSLQGLNTMKTKIQSTATDFANTAGGPGLT